MTAPDALTRPSALDTFYETMRLELVTRRMEASAWKNVAAQLGVTLNLLADEPMLDPDTRAACSRAYAQACAAAGVGEDA